MTEEELFAKTLRVSGHQRATFLSEACGGDDERRARIERLLQLHERQDTILDAEGITPVRRTGGGHLIDE